MSDNENIGSGWDHMLSAIINSVKTKNASIFNGYHELEVIQKLFNIPEIRYVFDQSLDLQSILSLNLLISCCRQLTSDWISVLSEVNNVSLQRSNEYRSIGNDLYKNVNQNGMECVNIYTRAIFTAPKNSAELGMAYANRAAALLNLGYHKVWLFNSFKCVRAKRSVLYRKRTQIVRWLDYQITQNQSWLKSSGARHVVQSR